MGGARATLSVTLRKDIDRIFVNGILSRIFVPKMEEIRGKYKELCTESLPNCKFINLIFFLTYSGRYIPKYRKTLLRHFRIGYTAIYLETAFPCLRKTKSNPALSIVDRFYLCLPLHSVHKFLQGYIF